MAACLPKGLPIGVGWVMQGWGGSYRGGVGHTRVEWVMQGRVGHTGVGWVIQWWGGSCWGVVGHAGVGWGM